MRVATFATGVVALTGAGCIAVALGQPRQLAQPPLSALSTVGAVGPAVAGANPDVPPRTRSRTLVVGPVLAVSVPVSLDIPAIGVTSTLLQLGQTAAGRVAVPPAGPQYDQAGWYRYSPTPGSLGPAVIVGHVDSAANGPSVFYRLGTLRPGDTVLVTRADGSVAVFSVDEVRRYPKAQFPTDLVYGNTRHAALRLITCGGSFDRASGHYRDNIVVLASLIGSSTARRF